MLCLIILCARAIYSTLVLLCICQWKLLLRWRELIERSECILYGKEMSSFHDGHLLTVSCMLWLLHMHCFYFVLLKQLRGWYDDMFLNRPEGLQNLWAVFTPWKCVCENLHNRLSNYFSCPLCFATHPKSTHVEAQVSFLARSQRAPDPADSTRRVD